jgi:hypothetical protein
MIGVSGSGLDRHMSSAKLADAPETVIKGDK